MSFNIKKISYSLMSRKITTVISFEIESPFEEWVKIFDSKEKNLSHSENHDHCQAVFYSTHCTGCVLFWC